MVDDRAKSGALRVTVSGPQVGARVEQLVMSAAGLSRGETRRLCEAGRVTLDGRRAKKGDRAANGAVLEIEMADQFVVPAPGAALDVRLERADLVVVSKPAPQPTVPLAPGESGTLANALVARFPEMHAIGWTRREPGLIHRLDTGTSGLLVAARNQKAFEALVLALRSGRLLKRYLAVIESGNFPDSAAIEAPLAPHPSKKGVVLLAEEAERLGAPGYSRAAASEYRVLERGPEFTLVEVEASVAFRHQVRVHLATLGHAILGDRTYGGRDDARLGARHALHASFVGAENAGIPDFAVKDATPSLFLELVRGTLART